MFSSLCGCDGLLLASSLTFIYNYREMVVVGGWMDMQCMSDV